jgi:glutamate/tyrosine decarboxylase-like PLP-dependent enzyme
MEPPLTTPAAAIAPSPRAEPLGLRPNEFRRAAHALVDQIADFLAGVPAGPVTPAESAGAVRSALGAADLPESGSELGPLVAETARLLFQHSLLNGHPRFWGYVTSSPAPVGMLGDFLAAAVNPNCGAWQLSPMATEIEAQTIRWIAELVGYPTSCGGLMVSGGNMANITALFTALAAEDPDGRQRGRSRDGRGPARVYASAETHTWLQKAAALAGIGSDAVHWIAAGDDQRIDVAELRAALARDLAAGERVAMVVGNAGTVSTGAVDPLAEIAALCRDTGVWFHVDGAYGGFAAALPDASPDLRALALADSVALDPHKWLYSPLEAGCVLVRDPQALRRAFSYHPPYYHFGAEVTNYFDHGPQNSRGFRALKVWLGLRHAGRSGYVGMIGTDVALAGLLFREVQQQPELEAHTLNLSIATFRYIPPDLRARRDDAEVVAYLDELNERLLERMEQSGEAFVSNAVVRGRFLLRACIVNFNTAEADVRALPPLAVRLGREVDGELRPL